MDERIERLRAFVAGRKTSQSELAKALGTNQGNLSKILAGTRLVSVDIAAAIERETDGAIRVAEWAGYKPDSPASKRDRDAGDQDASDEAASGESGEHGAVDPTSSAPGSAA